MDEFNIMFWSIGVPDIDPLDREIAEAYAEPDDYDNGWDAPVVSDDECEHMNLAEFCPACKAQAMIDAEEVEPAPPIYQSIRSFIRQRYGVTDMTYNIINQREANRYKRQPMPDPDWEDDHTYLLYP